MCEGILQPHNRPYRIPPDLPPVLLSRAPLPERFRGAVPAPLPLPPARACEVMLRQALASGTGTTPRPAPGQQAPQPRRRRGPALRALTGPEAHQCQARGSGLGFARRRIPPRSKDRVLPRWQRRRTGPIRRAAVSADPASPRCAHSPTGAAPGRLHRRNGPAPQARLQSLRRSETGVFREVRDARVVHSSSTSLDRPVYGADRASMPISGDGFPWQWLRSHAGRAQSAALGIWAGASGPKVRCSTIGDGQCNEGGLVKC